MSTSDFWQWVVTQEYYCHPTCGDIWVIVWDGDKLWFIRYFQQVLLRSVLVWLPPLFGSWFFGFLLDFCKCPLLLCYPIRSVLYNLDLYSVCASTGSVYPYLGEFNTLKNRPVVMAWCSLAIGLSMIFVPVVGWAILSFDFSLPLYTSVAFRPWRLIPIVFTLPGFLAAIILYSFPESPRFYMAQVSPL